MKLETSFSVLVYSEIIAIFSLISEMQNENARVAEKYEDANCYEGQGDARRVGHQEHGHVDYDGLRGCGFLQTALITTE